MERDCSACKQPLTTQNARRGVLDKGGYCRTCQSAYNRAYKQRQSEARDRARRKQLHAARERIPCLPIPRVPRKPGPMTYNSLHARLRRVRGAASDLTCVDCGRTADEWSYRGGCPDELTEVRERDGRAMLYTLDLSMYDPRCKSCHVKRDGPESHPCAVAACPRGTARRLDYCGRHWIGPRRLKGAQLGSQIGVRDEHGRAWTRASRVQPNSTMTHKKCNRCGETKTVQGFSTRGRAAVNKPDPYKSICLECDRIRSNERYRRKIAAQMAVQHNS
jgi:hypothetical protein